MIPILQPHCASPIQLNNTLKEFKLITIYHLKRDKLENTKLFKAQEPFPKLIILMLNWLRILLIKYTHP